MKKAKSAFNWINSAETGPCLLVI